MFQSFLPFRSHIVIISFTILIFSFLGRPSNSGGLLIRRASNSGYHPSISARASSRFVDAKPIASRVSRAFLADRFTYLNTYMLQRQRRVLPGPRGAQAKSACAPPARSLSWQFLQRRFPNRPPLEPPYMSGNLQYRLSLLTNKHTNKQTN